MTSPTALTTDGPLATEPVATWLAVLLVVANAGLALADAMDWIDTTPEQTTAIGAMFSVLTVVAGAVARSNVYAPATVARLLGEVADGRGAE